ncbi:hypothetical protein QAD02_014323 [Eretmocerus hayati]|uniref:Uncharacterized protein n=1 Tax=Eretmocerus hayati TaxID=131215 RepID=A0ACC2P6N6_9HYME|nr:hypothetical protein QAD02_014323 [Eretmocerus hayati]
MNVISRTILSAVKSDLVKSGHFCCLARKVSFKSKFSLDKLYPRNNVKLHTPKFEPWDESCKFSGYIPMKEIDITYSCSGGPGGQNVNRVNTKVDLRFKVKDAKWLQDEVQDLLIEKYPNKINKEGYLVIKSDLTRSQQLNLADALLKLRKMIRDVIVIPQEPSELTLEKQMKRQLRAAQERVFAKRKRSETKKFRRGPDLRDM